MPTNNPRLNVTFSENDVEMMKKIYLEQYREKTLRLAKSEKGFSLC